MALLAPMKIAIAYFASPTCSQKIDQYSSIAPPSARAIEIKIISLKIKGFFTESENPCFIREKYSFSCVDSNRFAFGKMIMEILETTREIRLMARTKE